VEFVLSDITDLRSNRYVKGRLFDLIYLSNIPSYMKKPASFKGDLTSFFNDVALKNLCALLKTNGVIAFCEVYSYFAASKMGIRRIQDGRTFEVELHRVAGYYDKRRHDILVKLRRNT
jgi:hypothetical protein